MSQMLEIVRHYALSIRNGRKPSDALNHLRSEVEELSVEVANGGEGIDGIKGEVMDVINCALDILFLVHPEVTMEELDAIMEAKCAKWVAKYAKDDHELVSPDAPSGGVIIRELHAAGLSVPRIAQIAAIEINSVERILHGSMSFRAIQSRMGEVVPVLRDALEGDLSRLPYVVDAPDDEGASLQELIATPVIDLARVRRCIDDLSNGTGKLWSPELVGRSERRLSRSEAEA
ncbi:hypothetical protein G6L37_00790 [Agrobacterium rubi]|nr:hypothetical protein [Agrobacterium rubi]NTF23927.1 hypothetical protein [Agrobacterium rubi]